MERDGGSWRLAPAAVLDGSPEAWLAEDEQLLVVTEAGIWTLEPGRPVRHSLVLDLGRVGPADSLIRASDGALYVGLRHYVLALEDVGDNPTETWFAPSDCVSLRMRTRCECVPLGP